MKIVRDHRAKWLPSRHHYALSKLIAFAVFRYRRAEGGERRAGAGETSGHSESVERAGPPDAPASSESSGPASPSELRYIFAIDRDQSALEAFTVSALVCLTTAANVAALLPFQLWLSLPLALILTPWLLQVPLYAAGIPFGSPKLTSVFILTVVVIASSRVAAMQTPLRYVAWLFFAVLALNAVAWVVVRLLGSRLEALEQECGA